AAPAVSRAKLCKETHTSIQVQRRQSDIPCAMVLTVSFALSPVIGLSCHRHQRSCLRQLDAGVEASGPHDFAVRKSAPSSDPPCHHVARLTLPRPPHPHPASVTIAIRPSVGWDGGINKAASTKARSGIFFETGVDRKIAKQPVGQISRAALYFTSPACGGGRRARQRNCAPERGGWGKRTIHSASAFRGGTPTPTLPRKRERERTTVVERTLNRRSRTCRSLHRGCGMRLAQRL
ncbi:MAG: hypothetical protein QOF94_872, partial [Acidobacteriaceae bacterium]